MKLIKFLVKEVQEEMTELKLQSLNQIGTDKFTPKNRWTYLIQGQDGNEYFLYSYCPEKVYRNMELKCFVEGNDKRFNIKFHHLYRTSLLTPMMFRKAKENYIERAKKDIEFWSKELQRLESL